MKAAKVVQKSRSKVLIVLMCFLKWRFPIPALGSLQDGRIKYM